MKCNFKSIVFLIFVAFFSCKKEAKNSSAKKDTTTEWKSLFNGKNLNGWVPKINGYKLGDNYKNTFRVENGVITSIRKFLCYKQNQPLSPVFVFKT